MTAAGIVVGALLALALLGRELSGILAPSPGATSARALRAGVWVLGLAFAALTVARLVEFLT